MRLELDRVAERERRTIAAGGAAPCLRDQAAASRSGAPVRARVMVRVKASFRVRVRVSSQGQG